jgi:hypothetical protein
VSYYTYSAPQDQYCQNQCGCECGYFKAREKDAWADPPSDINMYWFENFDENGKKLQNAITHYPKSHPRHQPEIHRIPYSIRRIEEDGVIIEGPPS